MKIGIISDSHDHIENIKKAAGIFKERNAGVVIHLGDYVNPMSVRALQGLKIVGIFGNNDGDKFRLINAFDEIGGEIRGDFTEIDEDGVKFAVYHGTEPQIKDALIGCGRYNVVIHGHTHNPESRKIGETLALNPGTAHGFGGKATIVLFDTMTREPEFIEI